MFPYIDTSGWHLGPVPIHPFGALVAIGIAIGYLAASRRTAAWKIPRESFDELCLWMIGGGFIGGHLLRLVYLPDPLRTISQNPLILLQIFNGIASFGSFLGGLLGVLGFFWRRRTTGRQRLEYFDAIGFGLPFGWMVGRIGCSLIHDHPGVRTTSWLAVRFPGGPRYDLGLLEAMFLLILSLVFLWLVRYSWPPGFFFGLFFTIYGPFRVLLDTLHVDPPRYGGFTVDQLAFAPAFVGGALLLLAIFRRAQNRV